MRKKILLLSGGLDSACSLFLFKPDYAITINIGVDYNLAESFSVKYLSEKYRLLFGNITKFITINNVLNLKRYEKEDNEIPMRNLYLIMVAINEIKLLEPNVEILDIVLVVQKDEMDIPDRKIKFFNRAEEILSSLSGININLRLPFLYKDKTDILSEVKNTYGEELARSIYMYSYSCYNLSITECGNCKACFRKWVAGINNDFYYDIYSIKPYYSDIKNYYLENLDKYSKDRQNRIITAIKKYEKYIGDKNDIN